MKNTEQSAPENISSAIVVGSARENLKSSTTQDVNSGCVIAVDSFEFPLIYDWSTLRPVLSGAALSATRDSTQSTWRSMLNNARTSPAFGATLQS